MTIFPRLTWPGVPLALTSAALFGASTPLAKALLGDVAPWMLAGLLYAGSGSGLAVLTIFRHSLEIERTEAPLRASDLPWLAIIVFFGGIVGPVLLMLGLTRTSAASASLLLNLEGVFTLGLAWLVFRENVDVRVGIGAAAIIAGAALLSWGGFDPELGFGALMISGACLAWAIDNNLTRKLSSADPLQIAMVKGAVAGTVNIAIAAILGDEFPPLGITLAAGVVGFLGYGVSLTLFVLALRHLGTARTGAYFSLAPFVGAAVAILGFGEPVTMTFVVAGALMALGLYLHLAERHEHEHTHEEMTHEHAHVHDEHHQHEHELEVAPGEPHVHVHRHAAMTHRHAHYPDIHHRHSH
jgi:drug/metabolite transporter (DMT)-like permease